MPDLNETELAANYGFAMSVLNSDPDLKRAFEKAVANNWSASRFQAEIRASDWYQQHSEAWRAAAIQKSADPKTYNHNLSQVRTKIAMMAAEYGAQLTNSTLDGLAARAYEWSWDDNGIRQQLAKYIEYTDGRMLGQAGQFEEQLRQYAASMGVTVADETIRNHVRRAVKGVATIGDAESRIREIAKSAYPNLAERIDAGETVADIASPYQQKMASLLELHPSGIDLQDPTIKRALSSPGNDGKPALQTIYDFENTLRRDARWRKTENARQAATSTVRGLLQDWGLAS